MLRTLNHDLFWCFVQFLLDRTFITAQFLIHHYTNWSSLQFRLLLAESSSPLNWIIIKSLMMNCLPNQTLTQGNGRIYHLLKLFIWIKITCNTFEPMTSEGTDYEVVGLNPALQPSFTQIIPIDFPNPALPNSSHLRA